MGKILVTKEWHNRAMESMRIQDRNQAFVNGLEMFLNTKLTPEQQLELEKEISDFADLHIAEETS